MKKLVTFKVEAEVVCDEVPGWMNVEIEKSYYESSMMDLLMKSIQVFSPVKIHPKKVQILEAEEEQA